MKPLMPLVIVFVSVMFVGIEFSTASASVNVWVVNPNYNSSTVTRLSNSGGVIGTYPVSGVPQAIAVDPTGNVWVTTMSSTVVKLSSSGTTLGTFSVGSFPHAIAIAPSGNVWVANYDNNTVTELSSTGATLGTFSVGNGPEGIAIDSSGNVWVADSLDNTVTKLSSTGATLGTFSVGSYPQGIAIDPSGNVWVANYGDNTVTELSSTGATLGTYTVGTGPYAIAIDSNGNVWVANSGIVKSGVVESGGNSVTELSSTGATLGTFSVGNDPGGIAIDSSGNVWVTNQGGNSVTELSSTGTTLGTFSVGSYPEGIAIDPSGNVWVTNSGFGIGTTVTELSSTGATLGTFSIGSFPRGIAIGYQQYPPTSSTTSTSTSTTTSPTTVPTTTTTLANTENTVVSIKPGWNLLSSPNLAGYGDNGAAMYSSLENNCGNPNSALWGYDRTTTLYTSIKSLGQFENYEEYTSPGPSGPSLSGGYGFWFYSPKQCFINTQAIPINLVYQAVDKLGIPVTENISQGWNLIGVPYLTNESFSTIASSCNLRGGFYTYNATTNGYVEDGIPRAGTGYWVYANASCSLNWTPNMNNSSPPPAPK